MGAGVGLSGDLQLRVTILINIESNIFDKPLTSNIMFVILQE